MGRIFLYIFRAVFYLLLIFLVIVFISVFFYAKKVNNSHDVSQSGQQEKIISKFEGEETRNYEWKYDGASYAIDVTLYASVYDFYKNQPKVYKYYTDAIPADWKDQYYGMFVAPAQNDETFKNIANSIREEAGRKKLSSDQLTELALAFVQSIPYDDERAAIILNSTDDSGDKGALPMYPYEVLYEQRGVCSDKSFLAVLILRELGFGTALFEYEDANHMAVGIKCPQEFSTENSGYCYAETTTLGHRIGIIPELDLSSGKALAKKELSYYEAGTEGAQTPLASPRLYQERSGSIYAGVERTYEIQRQMGEIEKKLSVLSRELSNLKNEVSALEMQIQNLKKNLEKFKEEEEYEKYNKLVPQYNNLAENYQSVLDKYNKKVNEYNSSVNSYNKLIKEFSLTE